MSYIPPNSSLEIYRCHLSNCSYFLDTLKENTHFLFVGDFNLGHIKWQFNNINHLPFHVNTDIDSLLLDFLSINNLSQINNICNSNGRILDLALIDNELISEITVPLSPLFENSYHHEPFYIEMKVIDYQDSSTCYTYSFDFNNADFESLN